ncbi:MAG: recombinase family protein [Silvanigrellaceae bacterium]|nr:recombinase family protein [Silvanigrellaceae bacterium]
MAISMNLNRTVAYLRVSTTDQDVEKNKSAILTLANDKSFGRIEFIEEYRSGKVTWNKRAIAKILDDLKSGDRIFVCELSRLGRSMLECMEILSIANQKGIYIYAVKGNWHLDDTLQSKVMAMVFSMASEIERDLISKRTSEALHVKRALGHKLGRPVGPGKSKLDLFKIEIEALLSNGSTQKFIAKRYKTTPANLSNWIKKNKIKIFSQNGNLNRDVLRG